MNFFGSEYMDIKIYPDMSTKELKDIGNKVLCTLLEKVHYNVSKEFKEYISSYLEIEQFKKGETIFYDKEITKDIYLILEGAVEYHIQLHNQRSIIFLLNEGNICASVNSLLRNEINGYNAQALRHTTMLKINKHSFVALLESPIKAELLKLLDITKSTQDKAIIDFFVISRMSAHNKLQVLTKEYNKLLFNIPQSKVAEFIGVKPETFSRLKPKEIKEQV